MPTGKWRYTDQYLLPHTPVIKDDQGYEIYPTYPAGENLIRSGFDDLASLLLTHKTIIIDCFSGVFSECLVEQLITRANSMSIDIVVTRTASFLKTEAEIDTMIAPWLGGDDPLFGCRTSLQLSDFFRPASLIGQAENKPGCINIIVGEGASLFAPGGYLVYLDLPKNELQFRARAGSVANLGASAPTEAQAMYKRFYFVDWIVLNRHREDLVKTIDLFVDTQDPENPVYIDGDAARATFSKMTENVFRMRPWFEPGTWGGQWIKNNIKGLNDKVPNYAWSFELISPENGILIESSGIIIELSFDWLMLSSARKILGDAFQTYGTEFPIRFDFLDTFDGGNLSVQCHPTKEYIKKYFGENFTQEETYYILDTKDDAVVYLGFQEDINPEVFRDDLNKSFRSGTKCDIDRYVLSHQANRHDLFLIPPGTIHGSGKNNLVLEISSTPYIFTFKLYDWVRPDLSGRLRHLNIDRGFENLDFSRKGKNVNEELISKQSLVDEGPGWKLYHLPTHSDHLYDVYRYHISASVEIYTNNKCLVMNLVEGNEIEVLTRGGVKMRFSFAETFIIPASAGSVKITSLQEEESKVVFAFVK